MKIISARQIKELDQATIAEQQIEKIELMERAAITFVDWFINKYPNKNRLVQIICGNGDNGGDGMAIGRLLKYLNYKVQMYELTLSAKNSIGFLVNREQILQLKMPIIEIEETNAIPSFQYDAVTVDAILGAGLNRPLDGFVESVIERINNECDTIIAVDAASGLFMDRPTVTSSIEPVYTFTFEAPKLAFLFPENHKRVGEWFYESVGSSQIALEQMPTSSYYITENIIRKIFRKRPKFAHKGSFGHSLLIVGSYGMMGAAELATMACLRGGTGLVTVHIPEIGYEIMQSTIPEAMVSVDKDKFVFTGKEITETYDVVGIGCGLGQHERSYQGVQQVLENCQVPMVIDADALNIIAQHGWQFLIPKGSIITPHLKEFTQLFGQASNDFERNQLQREQSMQLGIYIVLKGAHSAITTPEGDCFFNSTGNPGMATGGSGDVLMGMLTALLAQGYPPRDAAILGVYLHGAAGDWAAKVQSQYAMLAHDIVDSIGSAFLAFEK